jgi:DNA repair exonuclease SbcCD ATPase subunit
MAQTEIERLQAGVKALEKIIAEQRETIIGFEQTYRKLRARVAELEAYADKLAAGLPEGILPKDVELIREANAKFAQQVHELTARLTEAEATLQAYAEPSNWSDTATFEAEDYSNMNVDDCPRTYDAEVCIGETVVWVGDEDGPMLASGYFKKYDEQEPAQP